MKIGEYGEFGLINLIGDLVYDKTKVYQAIGDDCAVLPFNDDCYGLITCDLLVEGVHFLREATSFYQLGYKAVAASLSDIAAMGGMPSNILVAIGLPAELEVADWQEFYRGVGAICQKYQVNLIGGDTTKSNQDLVINVTAMGTVAKGDLHLRSHAQVGDCVFVTGFLGASLGGLRLILDPSLDCAPELASYLRQRHTQPEPCCQEIDRLNQVCQGNLHGLNDISDGLASECREIAKASRVGMVLYPGQIPIDPKAALLAELLGEDPEVWGLTSGEEYQLVGTVTGEAFERCAEAYYALSGRKIYAIGEVIAQEGLYIQENHALIPLAEKGFNHFKTD